MKINLAENMLRFGAKNLTEASKRKLVRLAEQTQPVAGDATAATTPPKKKFAYTAPLKKNTNFINIYGQEAFNELKKICSGDSSGPNGGSVWIPTKLGLLEVIDIEVGKQGVKFKDLVRIFPVTLTIPVEKFLFATNDQRATIKQTTVYNFLGVDKSSYKKTEGGVDMSGNIMVPEYHPLDPGTIIKYTWGDQNFVTAVNDSESYNASKQFRNDGRVLDMKFVSNFVKNLCIALEPVSNITSLEVFKTLADINTSTIGYEAAPAVMWWVENAKDASIKAMYTTFSTATAVAKEKAKNATQNTTVPKQPVPKQPVPKQ